MNKRKVFVTILIAAVILLLGGYFFIKTLNPRKRVYGDRLTPVKVETMSFYNPSGQKINGKLYMKEDAPGKMPLIIMCHGLGARMAWAEDYCRTFASRGWAAYSFDFRGGSEESSSDGSTFDMSIMTELDDVSLIIEKLLKERFVDRKNIFLVGESQGGQVAALAAAKDKKDIRGLVLFYPAFSIQDDIHKKFSRERDLPDSTSFGFITIGKTYFKDVWRLDPFKKIGKYKGPVLILHGDEDAIVPYHYSEKALVTYQDAFLEKFEGAGHGFSGEDKTKAIRLTAEFIDRHIR